MLFAAELWFVGRARHLNSQESAGALLGKERIDGFQYPAFPARHCLRDLRLQLERAVKIDDRVIHVVASGEVDARPGNFERKRSERNDLIAKRESTCHSRYDVIDLFTLRL